MEASSGPRLAAAPARGLPWPPIPRRRLTIAWSLIFWAGFFATLAVSWLGGVAYWHGLTRLRPSVLLAGLLLQRPTALRRLLGGVLHLLAGTFLFPTIYGLTFEAFARADMALGAGLGLLHGLVAGMLLPAAWRLAGGEGRAGVFGRRLGSLTPFGIVTTHVLYGALLGYIYVVPG